MSTTVTQPTITIQANIAPTTAANPATTSRTTNTAGLTPTQRITATINRALQKNPGRGPGGPGGPGRPGRPAGQPANQQNVVLQAADMHLMGSLPAIFFGN